jgi:hypothetical protein
MIDIWTKKNKDKDVIADEIDSVLEGVVSGSSTLTNVSLIGWTESNALETTGDNKLHLKSITLDFIGGS